MRILPVLDLLNRQVVRGVAGRREAYRPIQSVLCDGSDPLTIARAIRTQFGLNEFYVADLDAILHHALNAPMLRDLSRDGFLVMADAGLHRCEDAEPSFDAGVRQVVAGLETLADPNELSKLVARWGPDRVVFSLDLREGRPMGDRSQWAGHDSFAIARTTIEAGCNQLIVLDIARVGTADGVPTLSLCGEIHDAFPQVKVITGGGVRDAHDLRRLKHSRIDGVLVASALHNGSITKADLEAFR